MSLARSAALANINATFPTLSVWGNICYAPYTKPNGPDPHEHWQRVCPDYWQVPKFCSYGDHFGRWLMTCAATSYPLDRSQVDELATMAWLETLWKDGLLELIEYELGNSETAAWALDLPPETQALPFFLNTARSFDRLNKEVSRRLVVAFGAESERTSFLELVKAEAIRRVQPVGPGLILQP